MTTLSATLAFVLAVSGAACAGPNENTAPQEPVSPPVQDRPGGQLLRPLPPPPPIPAAGSNCSGPPPSPAHVCVQDCPPPVGRAGDPEPGWSWLSAELAENRRRFGCPICLPHDARIATPSGSVAISELVPGTPVWTLDASGRRARTRVSVVLSTPAPSGHRLAVIELSDGRTLRASPGHPDARGRAVGALQDGDPLDGSVVRAVRFEGYAGRTFDLVLEDGRHYWADGVLVGSSVAR